MPKDTFLNLKPEKRERIEKALIKEFSERSFEQASISNIITEAKIPRGSFYQYFEDKEDAIKYVIQKFIMIEHEKVYNFLIETNGDIFETSIKIFEHIVDSVSKYQNVKIIKNVLQELRKNNINIFNNEYTSKYREKIDRLINTRDLNIEKKEDLKYIMRILTTIIRSEAIDVISNKIKKEEGKKELIEEIEILKRGMIK